MRLALALCSVLGLAAGQLAAADYQRQIVSGTFLLGKSTESSGISSVLNSTRPGAGFGYGIRLTPRLTVETGVDWISHPLGSLGGFGFSLNAGDHLFLVPFGARYGFGPEDGKWRIYAGGGGAYAKHTFPNGPSFLLNQTGWGGYGLGGADIALGEHVRLGGQFRYYRLSQQSNVVSLGLTPSSFITVGPQISFTF